MKNPVNFDIKKAIETILYIIENGTELTFHHVSKVLYFADKEHLEKYGRLICGDSYVAMKNGPVPSGVYDLLKLSRGDLSLFFCPPKKIMNDIDQTIGINGKYGITIKRSSNKELFSDSDIECLNKSIKKYGNLPFNQLTELSHDKAWEATDQNDLMEIEQIVATFDNPGELLDHLQNQYPG